MNTPHYYAWDELSPADQDDAFQRLRDLGAELSFRKGIEVDSDFAIRIREQAQQRRWRRDENGRMAWEILK